MNGAVGLGFLLEPFNKFLARTDVLEICINKPFEVWVESYEGWEQHTFSDLSGERLIALAKSIATYTKQKIDATKPLLSGNLPGGERVQIAIPPAVIAGQFSITIRKPSSFSITLDDYQENGFFSDVKPIQRTVSEGDQELLEYVSRQDYLNFFKRCVQLKKNILVAGGTGSGKTQFSKALLPFVGADERIITIEDTPELDIPQPNNVRLVYSKGNQGQSTVTSRDLLESCLRMRPDRIHLQELRDGTAFYYLRNINSGHSGSITTIHADSAMLAFEQLGLLVKESEAGRDLKRDDVRSMLKQMVDVIVHVERRAGGKFRTSEIYFDPEAKLAAQAEGTHND